MNAQSAIEPGLIRIFRFFVIAETAAFLMVPFGQWLMVGDFGEFYKDSYYYIFLQGLLLSIYLSIPWLQRKLKKAYLFIAILIAIIIPTLIVSIDLTIQLKQGGEPDILRIWSLLPLLMIPLVPAAWQYNFRTVFVLFAGLGILDGFYLIFINGGISQELLMPLFSTFIRVVTLSLVALMITELMHTQREQRRELMRANLQLSRQAMVQEQLAVSRERNRLARELHDTLAHTLSGLTVQLEAIHTVLPTENEQVESLLSVALDTSRTGLEETRRAMKALRAEPLEDLGLIYAVRNLVHNFVSRSEIKADLNLPEQLDQFSLDEEQAIYRILQETLENIIRHAEASQVKIRFEQQDGYWQLSVMDNGVGFDPKQQKKRDSLGLQGMTERAAMMGASLSVKSEVGSGTEVVLVLRRKNDPDHRG